VVSRFRGSAAFVGRAFELSVLRDAWTSASSGRPCWVFVEGEAGIGKTRLVAEFARDVSVQGATVLVGNCPPIAPGLVPFAPIAELLRELGPSVADGMTHRHAEAIARLVDVDLPAGPSRMPGEGERAQLLVAVRAALERRCGTGPLLVVFEDLHWADASTREVLAFLASQPPRGPVMFVATYRDDERAADLPVWSLVDRLYRTGGRRLDLQRFGREEMIGLLDGLIGHRPDDRMIDAVIARSEGNPFLAEELVAADALSGVLPEGLRNLLLARTEVLSPAARQVIGLAAVAGVAIDDDLLQPAWLAAFGQTTALAEALRRAVAAGVLLGVPGQRRYAFRHALVRDAVYDDLLPTNRSRWHREIAACLARAVDGSRGAGHAELAARIAHHWLAAGDRPRALAAAIVAAEAAEQTLAFGEASRQYRTAVDLWAQLSAAAAGISSIALSELYERAASASYMSGDSDRAVTEVTLAIELTDREREPTRAGLMHERRAHYRFAAGHPYSDTLTDATTAVDLVPDEPAPARALVLAAMGAELMYGHRFTDAIAVAERALVLARSMGTAPKVVAHALSTLGISRAYSGDVAAGVELAEESVRVAAQDDDTPYLYRCYTNLSCVLMLADLPRAAQVAIEGAKGACRDGLAGTYGNFLTGNAIDALLSIGEWAQAAALLADGVSDAGADPISIANLVISSVLLAAWRGDGLALARDLASIDGALSRGGHPDMRGRLAVAAAEATIWSRDYPAALRYIRAAADAEAGTDDIDMRPRVAATGLRLLADWPAGHSESGQQRDELAKRMLGLVAESNRHRPPGVESLAFLQTAEAEAARLADTTDEIAWRSAIKAWERVPAPHRVGYARLRLAEALLAGQGKRRQAEAELGAVLDVAERLGARGLAEEARCLAVRARLRPAVADPADPADQLGLTPRERDVLKLVCAGRTNRQIATELFISPKTAELHVSHILAKLGVTTRGEAAAIAHRAGLD
jgi:DNA-binding CsgD family transcriptional regulator